MHIRVLGSAAGGGVPQWNCACPNCRAARDNPHLRRFQASVAVSADGERWLLANVTPDIRHQIDLFEKLAPHAARRSPIAAVALTDANIDHALGLLELRQAERLSVYSTETVRDVVLAGSSALRVFSKPPHEWHIIADSPVHVNDASGLPMGLRVRAIDVGGLTPQYDGGRQATGATSAILISDGTERMVYAPTLGTINNTLSRELALADAAFLDGTFFTDHELSMQALGTRTARQMGHLPVSGDGGILHAVIGLGGKHRYFTHINNTNPVLDPMSDAARAVREAGWALAEDGFTFTLSRDSGDSTGVRNQ
jgi:pyrroloquinoline quinone biosynthesis protein B